MSKRRRAVQNPTSVTVPACRNDKRVGLPQVLRSSDELQALRNLTQASPPTSVQHIHAHDTTSWLPITSKPSWSITDTSTKE